MQNLLLLHGALGHASQFDAIRPLLEKDFAVYTFNFEGHAEQELPEQLSIENFARQAARFINENIQGPVNIFGHSMGGYVGLYMAAKAMAPITKIMTLGTKLHWSPEIAEAETRMLDIAKIKEKVPAFAAQLAQTHGSDYWEELCRKTAEMLVAMGKQPPLGDEEFSHITVPVQLSLGDKDRMVTLEETVSAFRKLKNGNLLVMPDVPHPYEQVNTQRLADTMKRFFGK